MAGIAYVMNESLTPTKLDSNKPISPTNYPDKRSMVNAYKRMVRLNCLNPVPLGPMKLLSVKFFHQSPLEIGKRVWSFRGGNMETSGLFMLNKKRQCRVHLYFYL